MATLVTGAFGCLGAWVCKRLLEAGEEAVAFDLGDDPWRMRMLLGDKGLRDVVMVKGDIADRESVTRVAYFSWAAVSGPPHLYSPGPVTDDSPCKPATHDGVYKVANEETARIYWEEHKIPSMGFRPHTVYGPGRDVGLTADPGYQRDLGPTPRTALKEGIRKTLDEFAALQKAGRLDARELEPAK